MMTDAGFMDVSYVGPTDVTTSRFTSGAAFRARKPASTGAIVAETDQRPHIQVGFRGQNALQARGDFGCQISENVTHMNIFKVHEFSF